MNLFEHKDYKSYLKARVQAAKKEKRTGYSAALAKALGAPAPFVSQVLHTHVNFTLDHAIRAATHWGFTSLEREYFLALVSLARAGSAELREYLAAKLGAYREQASRLDKRFKQEKISSEESQWAYYANWMIQAIHMALTVPTYQTPAALAARLHLAEAEVLLALEQLEKMGLALKKGDRWSASHTMVHLPKNSPASRMNHCLWRQRATNAILGSQARDQLNYTGIYTLSRADFTRVRELLVAALESTHKVVAPSPAEELACVAIDWFWV